MGVLHEHREKAHPVKLDVLQQQIVACGFEMAIDDFKKIADAVVALRFGSEEIALFCKEAAVEFENAHCVCGKNEIHGNGTGCIHICQGCHVTHCLSVRVRIKAKEPTECRTGCLAAVVLNWGIGIAM